MLTINVGSHSTLNAEKIKFTEIHKILFNKFLAQFDHHVLGFLSHNEFFFVAR